MKLHLYFNWQIGFLISFGVNYENRLYICFDLPFVWIQILTFKINKDFMKKFNLFFLNFIRRFNKLRYMVNIKTGEIHDLGHETTCCNLSQIKNYRLVDKKTATDLLFNNYDGCGHCMPKESKKKEQ